MRTVDEAAEEVEARTKPKTAKPEATRPEKFPVRLLALDVIKIDHAIQSRVKMSLEDQREFSEAMLRGDKFPPVTVFFDGKVYWLADGFHRVAAARQAAMVKANLRDIRAEIRNGSKKNAMVFSAGANIKFSIPRTREDIKKAAFMILADDEWFGKSNRILAKHIGVNVMYMTRARDEYCASIGKAKPIKVETSNGRTKTIGRHDAPTPYQGRRGKPGYHATVHGKQVYLGTDPMTAQAKLDAMRAAPPTPKYRTPMTENTSTHVMANLLRVGIPCDRPCHNQNLNLGGIVGRDWSLVFSLESTAFSVQAAIGRVLIRGSLEDRKRMIVCGYDFDRYKTITDVASGKLGIEFLTPEELFERLKTKAE